MFFKRMTSLGVITSLEVGISDVVYVSLGSMF